MSGGIIKQRENKGWQQLPRQWPDCLRKVLAARGTQTEDEMAYSLADLPKPQQLLGMEQACEL